MAEVSAARLLAPGLSVAVRSQLVTDLSLPPLPEHAVLVNVGRPYRLEEVVDGRVSRTPGAPGDVAVLPAGASLSCRSLDGSPQRVEALVVQLPPNLVAEVLSLAGGPGPGGALVPVVGGRSPVVAQLGALLHRGLDDDTDLGRLSLEALGHAFAVAVVREHSAPGRRTPGAAPPDRGLGPAQLRRVLDHVEEHLAGGLPLADLAAVAHLSPYHFSRLFRLATGASPHQHVLARRTDRARELLVSSALPLAEVARRAGFADQSHLTRHVRRRYGTTPAALRAAAR